MRAISSVIFAFLLGLVSVAAQEQVDFELATKVIQKHVGNYKGTGDVCSSHNCCTMSADNSCSYSSLPKNGSAVVFPGGETRCIFNTSTPFGFQVFPGDSDKLVFYFQGGGACWDALSTKLEFCSTNIGPQDEVGIFSRSNPLNKFRSYTIVHLMYCSGDVWGGNTERPYTGPDGQEVKQMGLANAQSALDWVKSQQNGVDLASTLSELVVMGCSAGSIGAQLWANQVLETLKYKHAAVVPDSYAGIFPLKSIGLLVFEFGFCSATWLDSGLRKRCLDRALTLQEININLVHQTPQVPFGFVQSKTDIVQESFYLAVGLTTNATKWFITPTQFYRDVSLSFGAYNKLLPNFVTYLVDGNHNCFTDQDIYYTTDALGPYDDGKGDVQGSPKLFEWVNGLPLHHGQNVSTVCVGDKVSGVPLSNSTQTYCSTWVSPKTYVEKFI